MFCQKILLHSIKITKKININHVLLTNELKLAVGRRFAATLSPQKITELLSHNELRLDSKDTLLPTLVKSIECNQLASNSPIEDRLRISTIRYPNSEELTLLLGVFDGHGGGTTADLVSRRLFNYIALALHPNPSELKISNEQEPLKDFLSDVHQSPRPRDDARILKIESELLSSYLDELTTSNECDNYIATRLKKSFQRCDDDLSKEIQKKLARPSSLTSHDLRHYLEASISGCCAIVMVVHKGLVYLASSGDCRAVLGVHNLGNDIDHHTSDAIKRPAADSFTVLELNDEHNCDNIDEVRRLTASHPKSEQNTMIKHNRLLGHLMPFRAFGDFIYKWPIEVINTSGITRAFGPNVIPSHYETPPYLIVEPDVKVIKVEDVSLIDGNISGKVNCETANHDNQSKYLVLASDGLWELFESSRDVFEAIIEHSLNAKKQGSELNFDTNCATYILRTALCNGPYQDISLDQENLRRLNHIRLESTLTLPKSIVRNFRDDISVILLKLS